MGERLGIGEIVYRNELNAGMVERGPHHVASDAPEPVNSYFNCHQKIVSVE
jgi:hypothetical protein